MEVALNWPFFIVLGLCGIELVGIFTLSSIVWIRTRQRDKARDMLIEAREQFMQVNDFETADRKTETVVV